MRGVDDDDVAARVVRDAIGNVGQQKLLASRHAQIPNHDGVDLLLVDRAENRLGRIGVDDDFGGATRTGHFVGEEPEAGVGRRRERG